MGKVRNSANTVRTGRIGENTWYVRDGIQIIRQRMNNSNYGEGASRTEKQQERRARWANLVNIYKAMKAWQPKAYESKKRGQTDYNVFMQLNVNDSPIYLTKDMATNGCAVAWTYQISRGSLPPIELAYNSTDGVVESDIVITSAVSSTTTIGALSADIIANNPNFKDGDNIALAVLQQQEDGREYPFIKSPYQELTLDSASTALLSTLEIYKYIDQTAAAALTLKAPSATSFPAVCLALIHTRLGSSLQVSTQSFVQCDDAAWTDYIGETWAQECIESYGINGEVMLDPN